jgi:hypothetical protein
MICGCWLGTKFQKYLGGFRPLQLGGLTRGKFFWSSTHKGASFSETLYL